MNRPKSVDKLIEEQSSEWLVAMSDRTVSLEEAARFEQWLAEDPEHQKVYRAQKDAWDAIAGMPHLMAETSHSFLPRPLAEEGGGDIPLYRPSGEGGESPSWMRELRATRAVSMRFFDSRVRSFVLAASIALIVAAAFVFTNPLSFFNKTSFETGIAQVKDIKLDDGTLVTLGASSHIDVNFGKTGRRVILTRGEAFFEVTRDTARPFLVTAGVTQIRVIGTKFDVHYDPKEVRVSVLEGRVEVNSSIEKAAPQKSILTAGDAVLSRKTGEIALAKNINKEDLGAWRQGRLVFVDARLRDVIADINRYYDGRIELADESAGDLQLTAAFRADQIDTMLDTLQKALPIEITRTGEKRILLSSR